MDVVVAPPPLSSKTNCLTHGRGLRCRLEFVLNQLRIEGKLCQGQALKSRGTLCTCENGHGRGWEKYHSFVNEEFREAYRRVLTAAIVTGQNKDDEDSERGLSHELAEAMLGLLKSLSSLNQHGLKLLVVLLSKIMDSEQGTGIGFPDMPVMGRAEVGEVVLPVCFPLQYIGLLIGNRGRGFNAIKKKSGKHTSVRLEGIGLDQVFIRIVGTLPRRRRAGTLLEKRAQEIISQRTVHEKRLEKYDERRKRELRKKRKPRRRRKEVVRPIKDVNTNEYERQNAWRYKVKDPANRHKVRHKILAEGSRCLNCLGEFIAEEMGAGACTFHPGYIAGEQWTCCGHRSTDHRPSHDDHKLTGCSASVHNWRPTQKRQGKVSLNSAGSESKGSLLRDVEEILEDFKHSIYHV